MSARRGICTLVECQKGKLREGAAELVCKGREIASKLEDELAVVILGNIEDETAQLLAQYGADQILPITHSALSERNVDIQSRILADVIRERSPKVILSNDYMTDLMSRVAARLQTGLVTFCDRVELNEEKLLVLTKPVYGGKASATFVCCESRPQMATLSLDALESGLRDNARCAKVVKLTANTVINKSQTKSIGFISGNPKTIDLSEADIIVDGGRGLGSQEGFKLVEELADVIGGAIGASRMVVDKGWCSFNRQIGTTGKFVKPKLLIACGISGASQHIMGMRNAKEIIAINTDRAAPIFKVADIAVVADVMELLPLIISQVRYDIVRKT